MYNRGEIYCSGEVDDGSHRSCPKRNNCERYTKDMGIIKENPYMKFCPWDFQNNKCKVNPSSKRVPKESYYKPISPISDAFDLLLEDDDDDDDEILLEEEYDEDDEDDLRNKLKFL